MSNAKPWGDAPPLAGCDVLRASKPMRTRKPPARSNRPAVVTKVLLLNRFLDATARNLHPSAALVWVQLLRDERAGTARTAVADLARRCGLSPRSIKRHLAVLKARDLLQVVEPGARGIAPTTYRLHATKPKSRSRRARAEGVSPVSRNG